MAYVAPTTRADGYTVPASEWNQNTVDNPIALRSGAIAIASQAANDIFYASSASQLARLPAGTAGQVLTTQGAGSAPIWATAQTYTVCNGRLTLTTGTPVTTSDVTAAGTLYFALYKGNQIGLYTGSAWTVLVFAQLSIAVPAVANQVYDVFVDYNSGTPQLNLTAWTNDTTRATALTTQDGILVKTGATGLRYVGTVRTVTASQVNDSYALRHVWNYYNRVARPMRVLEATDTWTYTTATMRQANNSAANQLDFVVGVSEDAIEASVYAQASNDNANVFVVAAIGLDSTTAGATGNTIVRQTTPVANGIVNLFPSLRTIPAIGRHYLAWLEYSAAGVGTTTWYGDAGTATLQQSGIYGMWRA